MNALPSFSKLTRRDITTFAAAAKGAQEKMKAMPGVVPPLNYFDPWGLSTDAPWGTLCYYREAELKHGRTCMMAFLGILVGEKFHPFTGGAPVSLLGVPIEQTGLTAFFYSIVIALSHWQEASSAGRIADLANEKADIVPGDLGFDPLGIKPKNEQAYLETQNKELLNGRLAMIAVAGIVAQEA